ncbi:membrane protein [Streptosporangium violaceochromogenes]|nr:membrane protein [Streptosporangium violaceochromogenes]
MTRTEGEARGEGRGGLTVTPGMRRLCAGVLGMEAIVVGLFTPVAINTQDVEPLVAATVGIGLAVLCVLVAGTLKRPFAYVVGSGIQVLAIAAGFLVPTMFFLGGIFAALWITAIFVARRVEGVTSR